MDTLAFVLAAMNVVAPDVDHSELASAIAHVVDAQSYAHDERSKLQTAALVVAVAFREGSLRAHVEGDRDERGRPHSFCTMQIHDRSGGTPALNDDLELCVSTGLRILRASMRSCPAHPVAIYAEGPQGCSSRRAQRISADRVALAQWLAAAATRASSASPSASEGRARDADAPQVDESEALRHDRLFGHPSHSDERAPPPSSSSSAREVGWGEAQTLSTARACGPFGSAHRVGTSAGMMSVGTSNL